MHYVTTYPFPISFKGIRKLIVLSVMATGYARGQSGMISKFDSYTSPLPGRKYELKGNLLLFEKIWPHGSVELTNHKILRNDSLFYNYDKMNQTLLVTKDFRTMLTVEKKNFVSVSFFLNDSMYVLEHLDLINSKDVFFELIKDDNKYSLYKDILTEFRDVNYRSNGLVAEGSTSGELVDHSIYYIVFRNKEYKKMNKIDKRSIQKAFTTDINKDKVENWLLSKSVAGGEPMLVDLI
ncbi:MAG: hypothetical protein M3N30_11045, partial [Bacteroidota bacterium]|nr:hypothetical protein [Bacteroidota bacterium]